MTKTVVITGATSGIGEVAAFRLAESGARIVIVARNQERAIATHNKITRSNPHVDHHFYLADLSKISEMKRVATEIAAREPAIDILINNAGSVYMDNTLTSDGLAPTFATNHLAYYVLTLMLLPKLRNVNSAKIICTSSRAHRYVPFNFDNLQRNGILGYAQSKLMNLLFIRRLSQLLGTETITVNAFHPGFVASRFADNTTILWRSLMQVRKRLFGLSPEQGAQTLLYLAQSSEVNDQSGHYYVHSHREQPSVRACDDEDALQLWKISEQMTGVGFPML